MTTTRRLLGLLAATLLAVALVPLAATGEDTAGAGPVFVGDTAQLVLETGDETLTLRYLDASGNPITDDGGKEIVRTAPVGKKQKCIVDDATYALSDLLEITVPGAPAVGVVSNGIGSSDAKNCNTDNGRVAYGEQLELRLANGPGDILAGFKIVSADLDIEGKFGASLAWNADGETGTEALAAGSDNGADAGGADNDPVIIAPEAPSNTLKLSVATSGDERGAFSLEGGGDYGPGEQLANRSIFTIQKAFADSLDCTDQNVIEKNFESEGGTAVLARVERYDNPYEGEACSLVGVDLFSSDGGDSVTLVNSDVVIDGIIRAPSLRLTLEWKVPLTADGTIDGAARPMAGFGSDQGVYAEIDREIDLLDGTPQQLAPYCLGLDTSASGFDEGFWPAVQPTEDTNWCLLEETVTVVDGDAIQTQVYDGAGDPVWR